MKSSPSSISSFRALLLRVGLPMLLIAVVGLPLLDWVFTDTIIMANKKTRTYKMDRLYNEVHEGEIAMFGSSTVYRGYLPDSLGPQFYNYGMYGSNFQKVSLLLMQELSKPKTTPIVLDWHPKWLTFRDSVPIQLEDYLPQTQHPAIKYFLHGETWVFGWKPIAIAVVFALLFSRMAFRWIMRLDAQYGSGSSWTLESVQVKLPELRHHR